MSFPVNPEILRELARRDRVVVRLTRFEAWGLSLLVALGLLALPIVVALLYTLIWTVIHG